MISAVILFLLLLVEQAAALGEPQLCYILDAVLFLYGIVLTLLYCRLKIQVRKAAIASREVWSLPRLHVSVSFLAFNLSRGLSLRKQMLSTRA
uniref:Fc receptor, IgE, high affinity I, gamma polypeptide n=1 Tax=Mus musculus TaxID=10090 RepID=A0A0A6YVS1_MOUSE